MSDTYPRLAAWVSEHLDRQNARVVRELSGGNSNVTLLVDTDEGQLVLRTPPAETISPNAHRGVEREARVMSALSGHAPVPAVLGWCPDDSVIGRPFALIDYIDGVSITDKLPAAYCGRDAIDSVGEQLTDALAAIATAPWSELGLQDFGNPQDFVKRQIERWLKVRAAAPVRDLPQLQTLGQWLFDHLPTSSPIGIVHNDYHLDNTLCHADKPELLAVIDWEMATIGDPLADLGLFLMFWGPRKVDPPGFRHVQAVTRQVDTVSRQNLADRWSAKTGFALDHLDYYLCFSFWRLAAIVEGAYELYVAGKVDTPYARGLEYDVPALLREAQLAREGDW
ncbi:MAG: phosphotransferase family protein [Pseudomonadota bacterium]